MKKIITTIAIMLSVFAFSINTEAQMIEMTPYDLVSVPSNFSIAKLKVMLKSCGISKQDGKQIKGMKKIVNSLKKKNGKWQITASKAQVKLLVKLSEGKIKMPRNNWLEMTPYD